MENWKHHADASLITINSDWNSIKIKILSWEKQNTRNNAGMDVGEKEALYIVGGNIISAPTVESTMEFLQKIKNWTTILSANMTTGLIYEGM